MYENILSQLVKNLSEETKQRKFTLIENGKRIDFPIRICKLFGIKEESVSNANIWEAIQDNIFDFNTSSQTIKMAVNDEELYLFWNGEDDDK